MFSYDSGDLTVSRGECGVLRLSFTGEVPDGTAALVTLKRSPMDGSPLWEKRLTIRDNRALLSLTGDDTALPFGRYRWDIRLIFGGRDVETVLEPHDFVISEVVGHE